MINEMFKFFLCRNNHWELKNQLKFLSKFPISYFIYATKLKKLICIKNGNNLMQMKGPY